MTMRGGNGAEKPSKVEKQNSVPEPRTAEEWHQWIHDTAIKKPLPITTLIIQAIERAQEQARRDAIKECAEIATLKYGYLHNTAPQNEAGRNIHDAINALLEK